jgi:lysozyme family protein
MQIPKEIDAAIYGNNPNDAGGETKYGITKATAKANGYTGDMHELPMALAFNIYLNRYWYDPGFHNVYSISPMLSFELFDSGVNFGTAKPVTWLQSWLNGFNNRGAIYPDLHIDAKIGKVTLDALKSFLQKRGPEGEQVLFMALNCSQAARYLELAEIRPANEDFLYGWVKNRVVQQIKENK